MANKTAGTVYEYKFFAKILEMGYDLFIPAGDNLPIDCIIQNGAGKLYKVQIKGTACESRECNRNANSKRYKVLAATGQSSKMSIDCTKVDILAAYVEPVDTWYIIPCLEIGAKSVWFYPHIENSKSMTERYKEQWDLFKKL
jgi:hypothetical protein